MGDLRAWVSDKLMSLLGYSQPTVVQYVISITKKAASPAEVVNTLVELGLSSSRETQAFAQQVFARVEHKASGPNLYQQREREAAMLVRKQRAYTLIEADDEEDDAGGSVDNKSASMATQSRKEDNRNKKFRKRAEPQEDDEGDDEAKCFYS
ncbi:unnamed protein product [Coffea canephora]|uniref:PWI domain-containing protein n=1 Tax=Coffea canephora TaxID=49390 RepID=A0A068VFC5_COFCA|nr:unnamed protein product [Coffea canephora]